MEQKYFRVSSEWMKTYAFENTYGTSKVFEVLYIKQATDQHQAIVVLKSRHMINGEWLVFCDRGHFVADWTLMLSDGLFIPVPADTEESGTDIRSCSEFDSFEQAQEAAIQFNEAIRKAYIETIPKARVDDIPAGAFCRRIGKDGMPMAKTYLRGLYDNSKQRYPLVDPMEPSKTINVPVGTMVAIDV